MCFRSDHQLTFFLTGFRFFYSYTNNLIYQSFGTIIELVKAIIKAGGYKLKTKNNKLKKLATVAIAGVFALSLSGASGFAETSETTTAPQIATNQGLSEGGASQGSCGDGRRGCAAPEAPGGRRCARFRAARSPDAPCSSRRAPRARRAPHRAGSRA